MATQIEIILFYRGDWAECLSGDEQPRRSLAVEQAVRRTPRAFLVAPRLHRRYSCTYLLEYVHEQSPIHRPDQRPPR
jgi:hypothetical protein